MRQGLFTGYYSPKIVAGLMKTMDGYTSRALQIIFPLCTGVGLGMLFHAPYQVFLSALKPSEMASGTSAFFLVRFTGATIGLVIVQTTSYVVSQLTGSQSVAGLAFNEQLSRSLPSGIGPAALDLEHLKSIMPLELRTQILEAVASSIQVCSLLSNDTVMLTPLWQIIWLICAPCLTVAFLVSISSHSVHIPS